MNSDQKCRTLEMQKRQPFLHICISAFLLFSVSGCASIVIGGGTEGAVLAAQERSTSDAMTDAGILLKIKNLYADNDFGDLFLNVEIKVIEGRVLLTGNVDKVESQIEAVRLAWQIDGVKEVVNEIQVNDQAGFLNYAKDVAISTQIRTRFLLEKKLRSVNYSLITVNQTVYLIGIAQDNEELLRATTVASTTRYVKRVVSYVRLKNDPHRGQEVK